MINTKSRLSTASYPACVGGWNTRDALAEMKPTDAVILDNILPKTTECALRKGSLDYATGITGNVETLAVYAKANGTYEMYGAAGSSIYNVTNSGAVGAAVQTGLSNARFITTNFGTAGGKYLYMVNGLDKPRLYDGSTWTAIDGASTPAITGVTTTLLNSVAVYQRRLWFVEKQSMRVWYLPVNSIGGAAQSFDLSSLFTLGGYLVSMATITSDSGTGMDDLAVFVTSEGEVAVYRGIDPSSAATWYLVGVYALGAPVGFRPTTNYGADVLIISKDGVMPMTKALATARSNSSIAISDKIQQSMSEATSNYASSFGWEITAFPEENILVMNIPADNSSVQYVMYELNGSWCRFTGWNAYCFARMGNKFFYGTSGKVVQCMTGTSDNGANIVGEVLSSFQYHGGPNVKLYTLARPIISVENSSVGLLMDVNVDFDTTTPSGVINIPANTSNTGIWGTSTWGNAVWGSGGYSVLKDWQTVTSFGACGAIHLIMQSKTSGVKWQSVDYKFERGEAL